jgi:hypothetical protein
MKRMTKRRSLKKKFKKTKRIYKKNNYLEKTKRRFRNKKGGGDGEYSEYVFTDNEKILHILNYLFNNNIFKKNEKPMSRGHMAHYGINISPYFYNLNAQKELLLGETLEDAVSQGIFIGNEIIEYLKIIVTPKPTHDTRNSFINSTRIELKFKNSNSIYDGFSDEEFFNQNVENALKKWVFNSKVRTYGSLDDISDDEDEDNNNNTLKRKRPSK